MMTTTITTPNGLTRTATLDEYTDAFLDTFDSETPGTTAYMFAMGGTFGTPEPTVPRPVVVAQPTVAEENAAQRTLDTLAMRSRTAAIVAGLTALTSATSALVSRCKARLYGARLYHWANRAPSHVRAMTETRRMVRAALDVTDGRIEHTDYESKSEGLCDTTELSDDHPFHVGRYSILVLRTGRDKCSCADSDEHVGDLPDGSRVCGLCGYLWRDLFGADSDDWTHGRWAHLYDAHVAESEFNARSVFGSNPRWKRIADANRARTRRFAELMSKVETMTPADVAAQRYSERKNSVTVWRNAHIAKLLGFEVTPRGAWPGVRWDKSLNSLVREYTDGDVKVTRIPDMTEVPLTREQVDAVTAALNARLK